MSDTIVQLRHPFCSGLIADEENSMATVSAPTNLAQIPAKTNVPTKAQQIRLTRRSAAVGAFLRRTQIVLQRARPICPESLVRNAAVLSTFFRSEPEA
jgi:hypothetical protein